MDFLSQIDYTLLDPKVSKSDIEQACEQAIMFGFASVCVPPYFVRHAAIKLNQANIPVSTVISYPYGFDCIPAKVEAARKAIDEGANEIEMILNLSSIRENDKNYLLNEVQSVATITQLRGGKFKVIFEADQMNNVSFETALSILKDVGVDCIVTASQSDKSGSDELIKRLRSAFEKSVKLKVNLDKPDAKLILSLREMGVDRFGVSSIEGILPTNGEQKQLWG